MSRKIKEKKKEKVIMPLTYFTKIISFDKFESKGIATITTAHNEKKLVALLRISGIDIFNYSSADKQISYNSFAKATINLKYPHKYVFTDAYPNLTTQKKFVEYKLNKTEHPYTRELLKRELRRFENLEKGQKDKVTYLEIFADIDKMSELLNSISNYINSMADTNVYLCDETEYKAFFNQILSFTDNPAECAKQYDLNTSISVDKVYFSNNYIRLNNTDYATALVVQAYPSYIDDLLFTNYVNRYDNTICTLDVMSNTKNAVINDVKNSLTELSGRQNIKLNFNEQIDSFTALEDLTSIYKDLTRGAEKIVTLTLRFYIKAKSFEELNRIATNIENDLENIGLSVIIDTNHMLEEYESLVASADTVGNPFPLHDTFKAQYPFYFQSHMDDQAYYFGETSTGGMVLFDNFLKNSAIGRDSYDILLVGKKGAGKTDALKSMLQSVVMYGNKAMTIDVENEYRALAAMLNGKIIDMNRSSIINVMQLYQTVDVVAETSDGSVSSDTIATNFASELSRIKTFLYQYAPTVTDDVSATFLDILETVYKKFGIDETTDVTKIKPNDFPMLSDVYDEIQRQISNTDVSTDTLTCLNSLQRILKPLCIGAYSSMFNGHSTVDIKSNNFIVFNVKAISEMETNVYNAQLFNILSLMWSEIATNYNYNNANANNSYDRRNIACLLDESHRFINSDNPQVTLFVEKLLRRARKYYAGLWFASQSIKDFNPSGESKNDEKLSIIFSLVQYKMIMKQSEDCIPLLQSSFPQFSNSELSRVPDFHAGDMLLSFGSGNQKIICKKYISPLDFLYIGNSLDVMSVLKEIFRQYYPEITSAELVNLLQTEEQQRNFQTVFYSEVFEHFGIADNTSEPLCEIIKNGVRHLTQDLKRGVL